MQSNACKHANPNLTSQRALLKTTQQCHFAKTLMAAECTKYCLGSNACFECQLDLINSE